MTSSPFSLAGRVMRRAVAPAVLVAALGLATVGPPGHADEALPEAVDRAQATITASDLRAIVGFLADDLLQGRATGHVGNDLATAFLTSEMARHGLDAFDEGGHRQAIEVAIAGLGSRNRITARTAGPRSRLLARHEPGEHFQPVPASPSRAITGPVTFAGFGISAPGLGYDDFDQLAVSGRVVLVFDDTPTADLVPDRFGDAPAEYGAVATKARAAASRGAIGLLVVPAAGDGRLRDLDRVWPAAPSVRDRHLVWAQDVLPIPTARVSADLASKLLRLGDQDASLDRLHRDLVARATGATPGQARATSAPEGAVLVTLETDVRHAALRASNVLAKLEGADPRRRDEWVVLGAHFDHDGLDADRRVYNGADDNASGTAGVLEIAEAFGRLAEAGIRPARTVVFALWNGEEQGLIGSRAFVDSMRGRAARVVANLNLDMIGRDEDVVEGDRRFNGLAPTRAPENTNAVHLLGYTFSPGLAALARHENAAIGLTIRTDLDQGTHRLVRRSDHWAFLRSGVPALFVFTGLHPDYHTPADDVEALNFPKMERIVRLVYRMAWRLADAPEPPVFVDPSPTREQ